MPSGLVIFSRRSTESPVINYPEAPRLPRGAEYVLVNPGSAWWDLVNYVNYVLTIAREHTQLNAVYFIVPHRVDCVENPLLMSSTYLRINKVLTRRGTTTPLRPILMFHRALACGHTMLQYLAMYHSYAGKFGSALIGVPMYVNTLGTSNVVCDREPLTCQSLVSELTRRVTSTSIEPRLHLHSARPGVMTNTLTAVHSMDTGNRRWFKRPADYGEITSYLQPRA